MHKYFQWSPSPSSWEVWAAVMAEAVSHRAAAARLGRRAPEVLPAKAEPAAVVAGQAQVAQQALAVSAIQVAP